MEKSLTQQVGLDLADAIDKALKRGDKTLPLLATCHRCGDATIVKEEKFGHLVCKPCRDRKHKLPILKQFRLPRGRPPMEFDHGRVQPMIERYKQGESYDAIGRGYGLSRERVRQLLVRELGRDGLKALRREHMAVLVDARADMKRERWLTGTSVKKCSVCWAPTRRKLRPNATRTTCSRKCALIWKVARHRLDEGKHREHIARWVLRHPDKSTPWSLAWANRFYAGKAKIGKGHPAADSKATEAMKWVEEARAENKRFWQEDGELIRSEMDKGDSEGDS